MAIRYTDKFRRDAVRIAQNSGLTRPKAASDLGVGLSTLNKWGQKHQHDDLMFGRSSFCVVLCRSHLAGFVRGGYVRCPSMALRYQ